MRIVYIILITCFIVIIGASYWVRKHSNSISDDISINNEKDIRPLVEQEIEKISDTVTAENLDDYLNSLIEQARKKGHATALDVEPGIERIQTLTGNVDKVAEFTQQMQNINETNQNQLTPVEAEVKIAELANSIIAAEPESETLNELIEQYIETTHYLEPEAEIEAIAQLNNIMPNATYESQNEVVIEFDQDMIIENATTPPLQSASDIAITQEKLDILIQEIANTPDGDKLNQLIDQYLQLAETLPEEQFISEMEQLQEYLPQLD